MSAVDYLVKTSMLLHVLQWLLIAALWIIIGSAVYAGLSSAPWVPTRKKVLNQILKDIKIEPNHTIIDLGSGSGSTLCAIEKQYPDATYIGYEVSLFPYFLSLINKWVAKSNIKIKYKSLYSADITHADLIFIFLMPKAYKRIVKKLAREMKDDARVAIEAWPLKNIKPEQIIRPENDLPVYVYTGKIIKDHTPQYE